MIDIFFYLTLTFTVSDSATGTQTDKESPPKKRNTVDTCDSSVDLGSEDSYSVSETGFNKAREIDSSFFEDDLEEIKEDVEYYSPSKASQNLEMTSSKRKGAKGGNDAVELLSMLQGLKVGTNFSESSSIISLTSKPCTVNFFNQNPFMCYLWKDQRTNKLLTIEVLVHGSGNECTVQVEEDHPGKPQLLSILQPLPASWFSMTHFEKNCNDPLGKVEDSDDKEVLNYNKNQRYGARKEFIKAARPFKSIDDTFVAKQVFCLPFRCDDVNVRSRYRDTGTRHSEWEVLSKSHKTRKRKKNATKSIGNIHILTIQLVAKEKATEKKDKTPRKKIIKAAYRSWFG